MFDLLTLPFFQRALIVGIILGALMAVLGVLVVLRRMSFFSDAIGHATLTGIAIGLLLNINPFIAAFIFALLVAFGITIVRKASKQSLDTLLGVFFSASVALGVILVSLTPGYQADLISFLFGNILTVTAFDAVVSGGLALIILVTMLFIGKSLISITLDPSLAKAEGVPVDTHELILLLILAATIALAIKFVGVILVTAMLIVPAASAQNIARSLASMFTWSIAISLMAVILGMLLSAATRLPSGPTIVLVGTAFFAISLFLKR